MPIPLPLLDDRTWADLTDEGRALIPRYSPLVTNENASDPGITLIEVHAWRTEMAIYALNRVPARHRQKFLELLGFNKETPQAATTFLSLSPDAPTAPFDLPAGVQFQATSPDGLVLPFRTLCDLEVCYAPLVALQMDAGDGNLTDLTGPWHDGVPLAIFGSNPQPGATLYLGFSSLLSLTPLAMAFRFQGPGNDARERQRIMEEWQAQQAACVPVMPDITCGYGYGAPTPPTPAPVLPPYHSAQVVWEVFTLAPAGWWKLQPIPASERPYPGEVMDDTRSLTLDGIVEVNLPPAITTIALGQVATPLYYIRCRLDTGAYDAPPMLLDVASNAVTAEQAVPVWTQFPIASGVLAAGIAPNMGASVAFDMQLGAEEKIVGLTFYPVGFMGDPSVTVLEYQPATSAADGHLTLGIEFSGFGSGLPSQRANLRWPPVRVDTLHVYTLTSGSWQEWTLRNDFDSSTRTDLHFVIDPTLGILTFGDGERGQVVSPDALIFCSYDSTQAGRGNAAPGTITQTVNSPWNTELLAGLPAPTVAALSQITTNRGPATGGADAETLTHATGRAVAVVHAHERLLDLCIQMKCSTLDRIDRTRVRALVAPYRGVNLIDLERLALDVPGTRVARARAWADMHPDYPCLQAPGVVTVTVLPDSPVPKPVPSQGLLDAIKRYLERRRIVCTRLQIVGPGYVTVTVQANVQSKSGSNLPRVHDSIVQALNLFLDPRQGGPDGLGWPFGRSVTQSEILQVIRDVQGVDYVTSLTLSGDSGAAQCGNLTVCPTFLVTPGNHQIVVA